jgi:hypothetical protein
MTTSSAAGNAAVLPVSAPRADADRHGAAKLGWDPYEVWRTRVLLPRLAEQMPRAGAEPAQAGFGTTGLPRSLGNTERSANDPR